MIRRYEGGKVFSAMSGAEKKKKGERYGRTFRCRPQKGKKKKRLVAVRGGRRGRDRSHSGSHGSKKEKVQRFAGVGCSCAGGVASKRMTGGGIPKFLLLTEEKGTLQIRRGGKENRNFQSSEKGGKGRRRGRVLGHRRKRTEGKKKEGDRRRAGPRSLPR